MTTPGLQRERTALAGRRTLLSLIINGALLARLDSSARWPCALLVALVALYVYASPRRWLGPEVWCAIVAVVGVADILAIVTYRG